MGEQCQSQEYYSIQTIISVPQTIHFHTYQTKGQDLSLEILPSNFGPAWFGPVSKNFNQLDQSVWSLQIILYGLNGLPLESWSSNSWCRSRCA